jgi:hypothetical protein
MLCLFATVFPKCLEEIGCQFSETRAVTTPNIKKVDGPVGGPRVLRTSRVIFNISRFKPVWQVRLVYVFHPQVIICALNLKNVFLSLLTRNRVYITKIVLYQGHVL